MRTRREDIQHQPGILPVEQIVADVAADAGFVFLGFGFARDLVRAIPIVAATEIEDAETVGVEVSALRVGPRLAGPEVSVTLGRALSAKTHADECEGRRDGSHLKQRPDETEAGTAEASVGKNGRGRSHDFWPQQD